MKFIEILVIILFLIFLGAVIFGFIHQNNITDKFCEEKGLKHNFFTDYCYQILDDEYYEYKVRIIDGEGKFVR